MVPVDIPLLGLQGMPYHTRMEMYGHGVRVDETGDEEIVLLLFRVKLQHAAQVRAALLLKPEVFLKRHIGTGFIWARFLGLALFMRMLLV